MLAVPAGLAATAALDVQKHQPATRSIRVFERKRLATISLMKAAPAANTAAPPPSISMTCQSVSPVRWRTFHVTQAMQKFEARNARPQ